MVMLSDSLQDSQSRWIPNEMINVIADRSGEERLTFCMLEFAHGGMEVVSDTIALQCAPFPRCFYIFTRYAIQYRCNDKELQ